MTRIMYDALSTEASTIPADAELVAGYIDAGPVPAAPPWTAETWALFPHAIHVPIATQAATDDGLVLDVEAGDATPEQAPGWVTMRRAAGAHPTVYCSESAWPDVRAAFAAAIVAEPEWWIAGYPGSVGAGQLYPGSVAHQYGGSAAGTWDVSAVADHWPGVDPDPTPPPPEHGEDAMVTFVDSKGVRHLFYSAAGFLWWRHWTEGTLSAPLALADLHGVKALTDPTSSTVVWVDSMFGPLVYTAAAAAGAVIQARLIAGPGWALFVAETL